MNSKIHDLRTLHNFLYPFRFLNIRIYKSNLNPHVAEVEINQQ